MEAKPTRAERKAERALLLAAERDQKTEEQLQEEKLVQRKSNRKLVSTLLILMVAMPALAVGIMTTRDTMQEHTDEIVSLVETTYEVQDAGPTRNMSFIGNDIIVSVDGKALTCTGITKEAIIEKKPLKCNDGVTIEATRPV